MSSEPSSTAPCSAALTLSPSQQRRSPRLPAKQRLHRPVLRHQKQQRDLPLHPTPVEPAAKLFMTTARRKRGRALSLFLCARNGLKSWSLTPTRAQHCASPQGLLSDSDTKILHSEIPWRHGYLLHPRAPSCHTKSKLKTKASAWESTGAPSTATRDYRDCAVDTLASGTASALRSVFHVTQKSLTCPVSPT